MQKALPQGASAVAIHGDGDEKALAGVLDIRTIGEVRARLARWPLGRASRSLDLEKLESLDTPGALLLCGLRESGVKLMRVRAEHQALLDLVCGLDLKPLPKTASTPRWRQVVIQIGKAADDFAQDTLAVIAFIGRASAAAGRALLQPARLRFPSISRHVAETGVDALPIIALMAVMISIVIGYQGVAQLRPYGGEDFTINLVAVSMLREMGVIVTAIMVAGRSGSAFTAEIGVMRAREEVDALEVMGLDPMEMLVVPRVIALVITLPLLTFFSDMMGLVGGAMTAQALLQVSPFQYIDRLRTVVDGSDLFVGLVKAPVFAFLIAAIGCMHGLRVHGSAESVGRETTKAVVKSIFLVIVLDALFSILFEKLGL